MTSYDPTEPGSALHADDPADSAVEYVTVVPADGKATETAKALLEAAEHPHEVRWLDGGFVVPASLADTVSLGDATVVQGAAALNDDQSIKDSMAQPAALQAVEDEVLGRTAEPGTPGEYEAWKSADLKAEIDRRNEGRDPADHIAKGGRNAELATRLRDDDEAAEVVAHRPKPTA